MLIDACIINDELDMLEFRLKYLYDYVDWFIIIEADITHSGKPKALNFLENKDRFKWAMDKIIYHAVKINTEGLDFSYKPKEFDFDAPQWRVENHQRNAIMAASKDFSDDDIIMISDCDEIPTRQNVEWRRNHKVENPYALDQRIVAFYLNYTRDDIGWRGTIISTMKQMRNHTPQGLRNLRMRLYPMPYGGYHFTYFGGAEQIRKKIQSFAHQENNKEEYLDLKRIEELTKNGKGIFPDNGQPLKKVGAEFYPTDMIKLFPSEWWV
jgi:beta-1,4-mannosyl-glycoprotein beta-1,4-N-acetylglucosaminyltransferase